MSKYFSRKRPESSDKFFFRKVKESDKRANNFKSKIGLKFGRLLPIKIAGYLISRATGKRKIIYKCECDCGMTLYARSGDLITGRIKSCGCFKSDITIEFNKKTKRRELLSGFSRMWQSYKRGAKIRNLTFNVPKETFLKITQNPCYYCGSLPKTRWHCRIRGEERKFFVYNGLDRLNPKIGYEINNLVPCCSTCNRVKWKLTEPEFLELVKKIHYNHAIKKQGNSDVKI